MSKDFWYDLWYSVRKKIRNAYAFLTNRRHIVKIRELKRGEWYDSDIVLFHANFQVLVDYVENELGWMSKRREKTVRKFIKTGVIEDGHLEPSETELEYVKASWYSRWKNRNSWKRRLALNELDWEIGLKWDDGRSTDQAISAADIKDLYLWYTGTYKNRPDPYDLYPMVDRPIDMLVPLNDGTGAYTLNVSDDQRDRWAKMDALEAQYKQEDTEHLIRLIKVREHLWT